MTTHPQNIDAPVQQGFDTGLFIKRIFFMILPALVILGSFVAFAAMGALKPEPEKSPDEIKALPALVAPAQRDDVTLTVGSQGQVQPRTAITVVPQISGKITYMSPNFIEGGHINKGDILIRLERADYELRVVQARAAVAQAETVLTREESESAIARADWDDIGEGGEASALTLREPQMAEAAAQLASAEAQLDEAELQLSRSVIYAPFSGRVARRGANQGQYVTAGADLGEIYSTAIMDVRLPLTNQDLARAGLEIGFIAKSYDKGGVPVTLSANVAGYQKHWSGRIMRTDSIFDPTTRVLFAYVEVRDPFGEGSDNGTPLAPGLFVNAEIEGQALSNVVVIPRTGLRGKDEVYVARDDDTLEIRSVTVRASDRDRAILTGGLAVGERVITSPVRGVADGMKVAIVDRLNDQSLVDVITSISE